MISPTTYLSESGAITRWAFVDESTETIERILETADDVVVWEAAHSEWRARNGLNWPGPIARG